MRSGRKAHEIVGLHTAQICAVAAGGLGGEAPASMKAMLPAWQLDWMSRNGTLMCQATSAASLPGHRSFGCLALAFAGVVLTAGKDNTLRVVDMRTFEPRAALRASGFAVGGVWAGATLGPDEKHAAAGGCMMQTLESGPQLQSSAAIVNHISSSLRILPVLQAPLTASYSCGMWPARL